MRPGPPQRRAGDVVRLHSKYWPWRSEGAVPYSMLRACVASLNTRRTDMPFDGRISSPQLRKRRDTSLYGAGKAGVIGSTSDSTAAAA
jgi:hypothetical protein